MKASKSHRRVVANEVEIARMNEGLKMQHLLAHETNKWTNHGPKKTHRR